MKDIGHVQVPYLPTFSLYKSLKNTGYRQLLGKSRWTQVGCLGHKLGCQRHLNEGQLNCVEQPHSE